MITIYKYELNLGPNKVMLPYDAKVLSVAGQHNNLVMWVEVDTERPLWDNWFLVTLTGHAIVDNFHPREFIGTVLLDNETFILHVFKYRPDPVHKEAQ